MKNLLNIGKALNKSEQKAINGGFDDSCGILVCFNASTEGCTCYDNPNSPDGKGTCLNGMCCD